MVNKPETALKKAAAQSKNGPRFAVNTCQMQARLLYGIPSDGTPSAAAWWAKSSHRHPTSDPSTAPKGAFHYFTGGSSGAGHVMPSKGGSPSWSTDIKRAGYYDETTVEHVLATWPKLKYVGWTEDIDGVRVLTAGTPAPKPDGQHVVGIDVYHGNPVTEAALRAFVKDSDRQRFVALKATEGSTIKDETYPARRALVEKVGAIPCAYGFARPDKLDTVDKCKAEGIKEAAYFLAYAKPQVGDLRSMLDLEDRNGLGAKLLTAYVDGWVHEYERQMGCLPFIYTHYDLLDNFGCPLWASRYNDDNRAPIIAKPWSDYTIWQFSNGEYGTPHRVPGFKAHAIDLNAIRHGLWLKDLLIPEQKPPPPPPPDPTGDTFVNAQFNSQHTDQANRQIRDVLIASDLVGLNEVESLWQRLILKTSPKFGVYPTLGTGGYVPVCWRKTVFEKVSAETYPVHKGEAGVTPARNVIKVTLRHKASKKIVVRLNGQSVAHVEVAGRERKYKGAEVKKYAGQLARVKLFFAMMRARILTSAVEGAVVAGGDFNVDFDAEERLPEAERVPYFPYQMLTPIAKAVMPKGGSHGSRRIDWVLVKGPIRSVRHWLGEQGASDHRPVFNEFELL